MINQTAVFNHNTLMLDKTIAKFVVVETIPYPSGNKVFPAISQ